jgi:hypothetical protein
MTNFDTDGGVTRDDLVQRVALMETMIAEGRRSTERFGWIFVMWGLLYFLATGWMLYLPYRSVAWPVCIAVGIFAPIIAGTYRRAGVTGSVRSSSVGAVWKGMGAVITLYVIAAVASHHANDAGFLAAILMFLGLAHGTSAMILRWGMQGAAAILWLMCGVAVFFCSKPSESIAIFLVATLFGNIVFGLYVMAQERRRAGSTVQRHA